MSATKFRSNSWHTELQYKTAQDFSKHLKPNDFILSELSLVNLTP